MSNPYSFIIDHDSFAFFSNDNIEEDKETIEKCFFYTKETQTHEEKDLNNITSFTESDMMMSEEKKEEKTNDDLNETSMTFDDNYNENDDIDDDNNDNNKKSWNDKLHLSNNIFTISKKKRPKKKSRKEKRKYDADTMRRKIKPNYHKYIFDTLNKCIKTKRAKIKNHHLKLLKMNNHITSTVSIEFNKALLNKSIGTIIETEPISSKYKVYDKENNSILINLLRKINDDDINTILKQSYIDMYYGYLTSNTYKCLLKKIKKKDGEEYMNKFKTISNEFIYYFLFTEPKNDKMSNNNIQQIVPYSRDTSFNSVSDIVLNNNANETMNDLRNNDLDQSDQNILMMLDFD